MFGIIFSLAYMSYSIKGYTTKGTGHQARLGCQIAYFEIPTHLMSMLLLGQLWLQMVVANEEY
jgi:hypothetical protein